MSNAKEEYIIHDVSPNPTLLNNLYSKPAEKGRVSLIGLWKYARWFELILLLVGIFGAVAEGVLGPMQMVFVGQIIGSFDVSSIMDGMDTLLPSIVPDGFDLQHDDPTPFIEQYILDMTLDSLSGVILKMVYVGLGTAVASLLSTMSFYLISEFQSHCIRQLYFKAILRQDSAWFDFQESGNLSSRVGNDMGSIAAGVGTNNAVFLTTLVHVTVSYIVGLVYCWSLSLVLCAVVPVLGFTIILVMGGMRGVIARLVRITAVVGAFTEETIGNMKTLQALGLEEKFEAMYTQKMKPVFTGHFAAGHILGVGMALVMFFLFGSFALATWYSTTLVKTSATTAGTVLVAFMSILMGTMKVTSITPPVNAITTALASAFRVYQTIDRVPAIDNMSTEGERMTVKGTIEFQDVQFAYPARPYPAVFNGLNLQIEAGKTVALVGSSGSGFVSVRISNDN